MATIKGFAFSDREGDFLSHPVRLGLQGVFYGVAFGLRQEYPGFESVKQQLNRRIFTSIDEVRSARGGER